MIKYYLLLLLVACGPKSHPQDQQPLSNRDRLQLKFNTYLELSKGQQDPASGFILVDECDSLLFTSLYGTVGQVSITKARDNVGQWFRRPIAMPECLLNGGALSTISRDMFVGLLHYIYANKRLDLANDLLNYGEQHAWIMGQGELSRTTFVPGMQATLAEIIFRLNGENHNILRSIPQVYSQNVGFAAHLDMLAILLRGELVGAITDKETQIVEYNYRRVPGNAFYAYMYHKYADGNQSEAESILLDPNLFPPDRLPTSADHCEPYIWQRELGDDWKPCSNGKTHPGADFLYVAGLLLK